MGSVEAATITVCKAGGCNATTVQGGLDLSQPNDAVLITDSSTYDEDLVINRTGVVLSAATGERPVINGSGAADAIRVNASNVVVRNLSVWINSTGPDFQAIHVGGDYGTPHNNVVIENNVVNQSARSNSSHYACSAIMINAFSSSDPYNTTIRGNAVNLSFMPGSVSPCVGIASYGYRARIESNTITMEGAGAYGIHLRSGDSPIDGNTIVTTGSGGMGIRIDGGRSSIRNNTITTLASNAPGIEFYYTFKGVQNMSIIDNLISVRRDLGVREVSFLSSFDPGSSNRNNLFRNVTTPFGLSNFKFNLNAPDELAYQDGDGGPTVRAIAGQSTAILRSGFSYPSEALLEWVDNVSAKLNYSLSGLQANASYAVSDNGVLRHTLAAAANGSIGPFAIEGTGEHRIRVSLPLSDPPVNLTAEPGPGPGAIRLAWEPPGNSHGSPVTGYKVHRGVAVGGPYVVLATLGNVLTYEDTGLPDNATRAYRVNAITAAGEGAQGNEANATTFIDRPDAPGELSAVAGSGSGAITLTWLAPLDDGGDPVTDYSVHRAPTSGGPYSLVATVGNVLSFTDVGLPTGAVRYYEVGAVNAAGEGPRSEEAAGTTLPGEPRSLSATAGAGQGQIALTWSAPLDETAAVVNYKVYRSAEAGGAYSPIATIGNVLVFTDSGLPDGAVRYYKVSALNAGGEGPRSDNASATTRPGSPRALSASAGPGAGAISLAWQVPADEGAAITGYEIYRAAAIGDPYEHAATLGPVLTYMDAGLGNGAMRRYRVAALNAAGEGSQSVEAGATTFETPAAPRDLAASPGDQQVLLAWSAPLSDGGSEVTGYLIYRGGSSGPLALLDVVGTNASYVSAGLVNGQAYHFAVSAFNVVGEGPRGGESSATPRTVPGEPQGLAVTPGPGAGRLTLSWQPPASNGGAPVESYSVHRASTSGGPYSPLATVGSNLTFADAGLPGGATRFYRVAAINVAGEGGLSNEANATTLFPPTPPLSAKAEAVATVLGQIRVSWQPPGQTHGLPVTAYRVHRGTSSGQETFLAQTGPGLSYADNSCPLLTRCFYRVSAVTDGGEGALSSEVVALWPAGNPKTRGNADGTTTVYDDRDNDGDVDAGEEIGTTPASNPQSRDNRDGTCTIYDDRDRDGVVDAGETLATTACLKPKTRTNPDGTVSAYDDRDSDDAMDPGEELARTPASMDMDGDGVPDLLEPSLCANENPNFSFDGTCNGVNYSTPTLQGFLADVDRLTS